MGTEARSFIDRLLREWDEEDARETPGSYLRSDAFVALRTQTRQQIADVRDALGERADELIHAAIRDPIPAVATRRVRNLEARVRRLEQHLALPPPDAR